MPYLKTRNFTLRATTQSSTWARKLWITKAIGLAEWKSSTELSVLRSRWEGSWLLSYVDSSRFVGSSHQRSK